VSYTFLQEQGAESSVECFSDIPALVLSRLNLTAGKSCSPGSETESCPDSPFGMISAPSTEIRGEGLSISCAEDSPARTSARPEKAQESKGSSLDCGPRWPGSFARFDPHSCLWKTVQCSLFGGLVEFSETWPRWGSMRDGECSALPMPSGLEEFRAWITSVIESGLSESAPTPIAADAQRSGSFGRGNLTLGGFSKRVPTLHGFSKDGLSNGPSGNELGRAVNRMETPTVQDGVDREPSKNYKLTKSGRARHLNAEGIESQERLAQQVKRLPSIRASDADKGWRGDLLQAVGGDENKHFKRVPTMTASMSTEGDMNNATMHSSKRTPGSGVGGSLNPMWVEWLMGWPIGWTALEPLGTDKFLQWFDSHGGC
jgi:hypothetical protein